MLTSSELQRIRALFHNFGCTETETNIYLSLLQNGACSVQQIATSLKMNRITVHSAVEKLLAEGILYETRKGKRRLIGPEEPTVLYQLLQKQENDLAILKTNVDHIAKLLAKIQQTHTGIPTVKLYEGVDGLKKMLEETLGAKGEVLVFTFVDLFSKLLTPQYLENYYVRRAKKGIDTRLIFPRGEFGKNILPKASQYNMHIRFLPAGATWKSGIFAWNDTIAIQSFTEGKITCTIIENEDIAYFYRQIVFGLCWEHAQEGV